MGFDCFSSWLLPILFTFDAVPRPRQSIDKTRENMYIKIHV